MPGFGSGPFGSGPFGRFDWGKQVLFRDLPEPDRRLDSDNGSRLEKFADSIKPSFEYLLLKAAGFGSLRDPDVVRTRFNENISVTILSTSVNDNTGRTIEVTLDAPDPSDPFNPLGETSFGWTLEDADGRTFRVNSVHKLDEDGSVTPRVEVYGVADPPALGSAVLRPPALISFLGNDFGIEVDHHEPEGFQRSAVRNVTQWLDLKGTQKSYDIIGKISGYRITALGLWRVPAPVPANIPSAEVFEAPLGSGKFYTSLDPKRPRFDEIAADVIPLDYFCFEEPDWTTDGIEPPSPSPPDGTSVEDAIAVGTEGVPIVSSTDLGGGLWELRITADLTKVASFENWYAVASGMPNTRLYLESQPVDVGGGDWTFQVVAGDSPTFGSTLDVRYECRIDKTCDYCRASVIRVEIVPEEVLTDPDALLDGVLGRLTRKIEQVIPAHVRTTDQVLIIGPVQAVMNITATVAPQRSVFAYAGVGYYYDITAADVISVDPDHLVATGTTSTVP